MIDMHELKLARRIVFVCHGNICRSPMAESIMARLLMDNCVHGINVESAATSSEELGNPVHRGAVKQLLAHGVEPVPHRACLLRAGRDPGNALFVGMDSANVANMVRMLGPEYAGKCCRLLDFTASPRDIADPWYTGDFSKIWDDIMEGCLALLEHIMTGG